MGNGKLHFSDAASSAVISKLRHEQDQDNVGMESANTALDTASATGRLLQNSIRARNAYSKTDAHTTSREHQKKHMKRLYAHQAGNRKNGNVDTRSVAAGRKRRSFKDHAVQLLHKHRHGIMIAVFLLLMLAFFLNVMSCCSALLEGGLSGLAGATYPSLDADMQAAETAYAALEAALQQELDNYEELHPGADEYVFDLDSIGHDPYVLISILTALHGGSWTIDDVQNTLTMLFEQQYTLAETVTSVPSIRQELQRGEDGRLHLVTVPYDHKTCTVKLDNFDLSHLPVYIMTEDQVAMYALYMASLGNRPDLFPQSQFPNASTELEYEDYDIPPEALEDDAFAAIIEEAEKYLGFPYVWGGSNPSTSFDCSGFVSWVINHSGWSVGRLSAQGLLDICTRVSSTNVRPGDLIFFEKTYETAGASHVGIYVGNNKMIHCGNPISYTSTNSSYWQDHFLAYGRLP